MTRPSFTQDQLLRRWRARTCAGIVTITTYDAGTDSASRRQMIGYTAELDHIEIFRGTDIGVPVQKALDSDEVLAAVIGFLSLRLGDTDAEFFADYAPGQLSFADACGEELSLIGSELHAHACLPGHHKPVAGDVMTLDDAESALAHLSTSAGQMTRDIEQLQAHLATADLDIDTLGEIADVLDSAAAVRVTADWAHESLTARHAEVAVAMRATNHPAHSSFYRH